MGTFSKLLLVCRLENVEVASVPRVRILQFRTLQTTLCSIRLVLNEIQLNDGYLCSVAVMSTSDTESMNCLPQYLPIYLI